MNISVEKAKEIREDIGASHLILLARGADGSEVVSTHGENEQQAHEAAAAGNQLKKLLGWPESLCQSTPQQRAEWNRKTVPEIRADIERLLRQQQRNESEQEARLNEYASSRDTLKREILLREYTKVGRLNEDYFVRIQALDWVLNGAPTAAPSEPVVVYQWVGKPDVAAFEHYIEHYHDQQEDALAEAAREHYQDWLDTREPGDEYVVSENDHSLDPYEPSFEVVHVDKSEYGHHYQLTFPRTAAALHFGLGWGKVQQAAQQLEFTLAVGKEEAEHLASFLLREAANSYPTKDWDTVVEGSFEVRTHDAQAMFNLGANWERYQRNGYQWDEKQTAGEVLAYPAMLTPELDEALGWPNFKCGPFAHVFRAAGYEIPTKAEREQAFVLHWLTGLVLKHGANWKQQASAELDALQDKIVSKGAGQ